MGGHTLLVFVVALSGRIFVADANFLSSKAFSPVPLRLRGGDSGYSLGIRDSIMIAHSFKGAEFGPAQNLHGATYTVEVEFHVEKLVPRLNWVLDIGIATQMLKEVLQTYNYKNLDEIFQENSTTEFMCREIFNALDNKLHGTLSGSMTVKLHESHIAWASYHGAISA